MNYSTRKLTFAECATIADQVRANRISKASHYAIFDIEDFGGGHLIKVSATYVGINDQLTHEWRVIYGTYNPSIRYFTQEWSNICN